MSEADQTRPDQERRQHVRREADRTVVARLESLLEASKSMNSTLDLDRLLELIVELVTENVHADRSTLY
ncbi:MAG: hypothetical protein ACE5GH_04955, partial [Fidelibacterota bacterium]